MKKFRLILWKVLIKMISKNDEEMNLMLSNFFASNVTARNSTSSLIDKDIKHEAFDILFKHRV